MKSVFVIATSLISLSLQAQSIQSDCVASELKALAAPEIAAQFVKSGVVRSLDCAPAKGPGGGEMLVVTLVVNTKTGHESYLALFDRKGFSAKSLPVFKSPVLGFDLFPLLVAQKYRQIFIHPSSDASRLVIFMNIQAGPQTTRLSRWDYLYERKDLSEGHKVWMIEAGVLPKIYEDSGVQRALIGARSVEL